MDHYATPPIQPPVAALLPAARSKVLESPRYTRSCPERSQAVFARNRRPAPAVCLAIARRSLRISRPSDANLFRDLRHVIFCRRDLGAGRQVRRPFGAGRRHSTVARIPLLARILRGWRRTLRSRPGGSGSGRRRGGHRRVSRHQRLRGLVGVSLRGGQEGPRAGRHRRQLGAHVDAGSGLLRRRDRRAVGCRRLRRLRHGRGGAAARQRHAGLRYWRRPPRRSLNPQRTTGSGGEHCRKTRLVPGSVCA